MAAHKLRTILREVQFAPYFKEHNCVYEAVIYRPKGLLSIVNLDDDISNFTYRFTMG